MSIRSLKVKKRDHSRGKYCITKNTPSWKLTTNEHLARSYSMPGRSSMTWKHRYNPVPKCQNKQQLVDVTIHRKQYGGNPHDPHNIREQGLCAACNEDYGDFAKQFADITSDAAGWKGIFKQFLDTLQPDLSYEQRRMLALKELTGLRMELHEEKLRFSGRYRNRSRRLQELLPVSSTPFAKSLLDTTEQHEDWLSSLMEPYRSHRCAKKAARASNRQAYPGTSGLGVLCQTCAWPRKLDYRIHPC